jgi:hypothetical protein
VALLRLDVILHGKEVSSREWNVLLLDVLEPFGRLEVDNLSVLPCGETGQFTEFQFSIEIVYEPQETLFTFFPAGDIGNFRALRQNLSVGSGRVVPTEDDY